jgi:uncharacterized protein (TIRG00374 family)
MSTPGSTASVPRRANVTRAMILTFEVCIVLATVCYFWRSRVAGGATLGAIDRAHVMPLLVSALAALVCAFATGGMYRHAMACSGVDISLARGTRLSSASHFLNTVTPSGGWAGAPLFVREAALQQQAAGSAIAAYLTASLLGRVALAVSGIGVLQLCSKWHCTLRAPLLIITAFALVTGLMVGVVATVLAHDERAARASARVRRLVRLDRDQARLRTVDAGFLTSAVQLYRSPARLLPALGWSLLGKFAGGMLVWSVVNGAGGSLGPGQAIAAYVVAAIAGLVVPLLPAGLGVLEATLASTLVGFGVPLPIASAATLLYRAFQLWIPLAAGAICALGLRYGMRPSAVPSMRKLSTGVLRRGEPLDGRRRLAST